MSFLDTGLHIKIVPLNRSVSLLRQQQHSMYPSKLGLARSWKATLEV